VPLSVITFLFFPKVSEFIIHDHVYHYFKHKLNTSQHSFNKSKSTVINWVPNVDFFASLLCS
jgi:hypothetical protein